MLQLKLFRSAFHCLLVSYNDDNIDVKHDGTQVDNIVDGHLRWTDCRDHRRADFVGTLK
jgi:hypothetical protein